MHIQQKYDSVRFEPPAPVIDIKIKAAAADDTQRDVALKLLIDSGADATMLPEDALIALGAERIDRRRSRGIYGHARMVSIYLVDVQIGTMDIHSVQAVGVSEESEALIGRDILNQLIVTLDGVGGITEIS